MPREWSLVVSLRNSICLPSREGNGVEDNSSYLWPTRRKDEEYERNLISRKVLGEDLGWLLNEVCPRVNCLRLAFVRESSAELVAEGWRGDTTNSQMERKCGGLWKTWKCSALSLAFKADFFLMQTTWCCSLVFWCGTTAVICLTSSSSAW